MHAAPQRHHRFEHELAAADGGERTLAQTAGERQQQQVGQAEAVDGGHERHRHAATERARRAQTLHHVHEPEHGAEDAERGGVAAGGFEDPRGLVIERFAGAHLGSQQVADQGRLHAVHHQRQSIAQELVVDPLDVGLERQDAAAMGANGHGHELGGERSEILVAVDERPPRLAHGVEHGARRVADERGRQRPADHDQRRGRLQKCTSRTAVEQLRHQHHADGGGNGQQGCRLETTAGGPRGREHQATSSFCPAASMRARSEG